MHLVQSQIHTVAPFGTPLLQHYTYSHKGETTNVLALRASPRTLHIVVNNELKVFFFVTMDLISTGNIEVF